MHTSLLLAAVCSITGAAARPTPEVKTPHARINGFIDESYAPNVVQYLGIPFAEPPLDSLRFMPPVPVNVSGHFKATTLRPGCSQWLTALPSIADLTPELNPPAPYWEDCLYLNVFAPRKPKSNAGKLPTVVWVYGGELIWGSTNVPAQLPMKWVERSQEHIMVQISYRLNVFGFPNARGLKDHEQNAGVQDARMALEWVRDNIEHFGGDKDHIIMQGQAAGGALIDLLQYAYQDDPIAKGMILESGVASMLNGTSSDPHHKHKAFTMLAQDLGCNVTTGEEELACMRNMGPRHVEDFLQKYTDAEKMPELDFSPIADGKRVFTISEYESKFSTSKLPAIIGFNAREGSTFVPFTGPKNPGATPQLIKNYTLWEVQCPVTKAITQRSKGKAPTYHYFYSGNFTNVSPEPWMGAFHMAELPLIFGTHADLSPPSTKYEFDVSHAMQDMWLAFVKDPTNGLKKMGWPMYKPDGQMLHIAPQGSNMVTRLSSVSKTDDQCSTF